MNACGMVWRLFRWRSTVLSASNFLKRVEWTCSMLLSVMTIFFENDGKCYNIEEFTTKSVLFTSSFSKGGKSPAKCVKFPLIIANSLRFLMPDSIKRCSTLPNQFSTVTFSTCLINSCSAVESQSLNAFEFPQVNVLFSVVKIQPCGTKGIVVVDWYTISALFWVEFSFHWDKVDNVSCKIMKGRLVPLEKTIYDDYQRWELLGLTQIRIISGWWIKWD